MSTCTVPADHGQAFDFAVTRAAITRIFPMLVLAAMVGEVRAAVMYTGQSRLVDATAAPSGGVGSSDTKTAPSFAPWVESASIVYSSPGGGSSASASQSSALGSAGITMDGFLAAAASDGYVGIGQSALEVTFELDEPTPYTSMLTGPVAFFSLTNSGSAFDANSSGTLPAANYTLLVRFVVSAGPLADSAEGAYTYSLSVPEPSSAWSAATAIAIALLVCAAGSAHRARVPGVANH